MAGQSGPRERVLVVEDEPNIREIINFNLENWGFEVVQANDGETALAMAEEYSPDLILLDLMLPKMDGIEVCRRLKSGFWTSRIPVIMLTAKKEIKDKVRGMEVGADDYITKPFSREELEARVKMVLSRTRSQRERNPLTSLPGQIAVQGHVERLLAERTPFTLLYLDLDNFKGYNDYYGHSRGDEVIKLLADVIVSVVAHKGAHGDYVGHIGGDDFTVVCSPEGAKEVSDDIVADFENKVTSLFAPEDLARGYFITVDRQGHTAKQPCKIHVTVAAVPNDDDQYSSYVAMVDVATELKKYGKTKKGSVVVFDRRRGA
ncbi:MAG TPA: response regulator [bacterium]|nr:response regulator [bacterium]